MSTLPSPTPRSIERTTLRLAAGLALVLVSSLLVLYAQRRDLPIIGKTFE